MTISTYAATEGPAFSPAAGAGYRPGVCNIGPAEIDRRRRAGHLGLLVTVVLFAILIVANAPPILRPLLALPAIVAASGYLQAWSRFCAGFGARGIFNFGPVGPVESVPDVDARARDRVRARQIGLASLAIGVGVAVVAVALPV
jgi:hypothetical protein